MKRLTNLWSPAYEEFYLYPDIDCSAIIIAQILNNAIFITERWQEIAKHFCKVNLPILWGKFSNNQ